MAHAEGFLPMDHRYCSMMPALDKFPCSNAIPAIHPCCRSSFAMHPAWITKPLAPLRCQRFGCCLPSLGPAWQRLSTSQRSAILAKNVPVLVRGEHDGFYYRGTVKEEMENERGMFLVEFTRPLDLHGRHSVCVQKAAKDDILEYANGMKHSLLPGDKVLAPWEPDLVRYGPGTVLTGIETRDPLRVLKLPGFLFALHIAMLSTACSAHPAGHFSTVVVVSQVFQRGAEEAELSSKSSPRLLELEGPKQGELAAVAARSLSSDSEVFPTQSTAVDSTVDTDPSCPEKPRLEESAGPSGNTPEGTTASLVPVIQELADAAAYVQRASWNPKPSLLWTCPVLHHLIRLQCLKPQSSLLEGNSQ
ncbi:uncharacterized protein C11orf16 homolog isoform X3 [Gallus gallus]|uniref:uncharacterized protein C11orf16 homolog isoform X3 n=1 Tax=Gallus gallus TaxID=9031 RepID=UPI001AE938DE|nr:uncharacterized protein C11orf16 homolog isoform X3 [Gallus gallus]